MSRTRKEPLTEERIKKWMQALIENVTQLKQKRGKYYMRWKRAMEAYFAKKGESRGKSRKG